MAYDLNFGISDMPFGVTNFNAPTQQPTNLFSSFGQQAAPVPAAGGLGSTFASWLPGQDTMRSLFGGTDPQTGFASTGIVAPLATGLGSLFQGWNAMNQYGLAKDQLNFQKQAYGTNLANQALAYNTALEDRIRGRTSAYAGKEEDVQKELASKRINT